MNEAAFIVKKDSTLYDHYFKAKDEKTKFKKLANKFFKKYNLGDDSGHYHLSENLTMTLSEDEFKKYKHQLCKSYNNDNFYTFKVKSDMNQKWIEEVSSKIDFNKLMLAFCWYWKYITRGKSALFDYNNVLYGYLLDEDHDEVALDDNVKRIKMSEFWKIKEEIIEKESRLA